MIISLVNKIALHIVVGEFLSVKPTCLTPHRAASEKETVALYTAVLSWGLLWEKGGPVFLELWLFVRWNLTLYLVLLDL